MVVDKPVPRKVLVVEDETLVRALIEEMLVIRGFQVRSEGNVNDARVAADEFLPDVLVVDIHLGTSDNGIDLAHAILSRHELLGLVFLTNVPNPRLVGADAKAIPRHSAYLNKNRLGDPEILVEAIEASIFRKVPKSYRDDKASDEKAPDLSRTQIEVLKLIAEGLSNQEIAAIRGTSLRAVEHLLQRAYEALGVSASAPSNVRVKAVLAFLKAAGVSRG